MSLLHDEIRTTVKMNKSFFMVIIWLYLIDICLVMWNRVGCCFLRVFVGYELFVVVFVSET